MDRKSRLLGTVTRTQRIIEIGPGYTPVAAKAEGWLTHTVDHAAKAELQAKYSRNDAAANLAEIDINAIEDVDTVWTGGLLHDAVPADLLGQVDLIIASHVLEHFPDLVGFLTSASRLVGPEGALSVALPDRRYCFDCFRPWTTTGALLEAHHRGLTRHSLKTAFDHMAYSASAGQQLGWGPRPIDLPVLMDPFATAATIAASFHDQPDRPYEDYHAWQFTPAGFQLAILELAALGVSDWYLDNLESGESFEFFAVLRRGRRHGTNPIELQRLRRDLLIAQLVETREQIDFMLRPGANAETKSKRADDTYQDFLAKVAAFDDGDRKGPEPQVTSSGSTNPIHAIWRRMRGGQ